MGLRPRGGGVRTEEGRSCRLGLVVAAWWQGRDGRGRSLLSQAKRGHWKQLSAPILESNCGSERGGDLPKVTQGDKAD